MVQASGATIPGIMAIPLNVLCWQAGLLGVLVTGGSALAQVAPGAALMSQPVIQALPANDGLSLNAALAKLARNPKDLDALIDAGNAAMAIGDVDAAIGFLNRANQVAPGTPRVKAGLASALVLSGNPYDAFPLFQEAEAAGVTGGRIAIDHGLALDLVGDNNKAQGYYRQAFGSAVNDEAIRRLALSQAIGGDRRGSESTLGPLLQREDRAAWRVRAFTLAIVGATEEGVAIANSALPSELAAGIAPYLRYMPQLTPAQQAAAANFGQFPRASEIGRDDPRVALYAPSGPPRRVALATADGALIPKGEPLGRTSSSRRREPAKREPAAAPPARAAPPEVKPSIASTPAGVPLLAAAEPPLPATAPVPAVPVAAAPAVQTPVVATAPGTVAATRTETIPIAQVVTPIPAAVEAPVAAKPLEPISVSPALAVPAVAAPVPVSPAPPAKRPSLAEAFGDLGKPAAAVTPATGAVDIRRIKPVRETADGKPVPATPAKPAPPTHPSRIWVQVATGRSKTALGADWKRLAKQAEAPFRGKSAWLSAWGQTNRLLAGPFETNAAANAFVAQLRRADVDGAFVWTSPAGQVVDSLGGRAEPAPPPEPPAKAVRKKRR